jgi:hypothetical protein
MANTYNQIIQDIDEHLQKSKKGYYSDFYIGTTKDIKSRLFEYHNVPTSRHWYIYRTATDEDTARKVEKHYLDLGMRGNGGDGDSESNIVYCYEINSITKE